MSAAPSKDPSWPPKSPHEALLSSPSGRKKYERQREDVSPSPSPFKRRLVGMMDKAFPEISSDEDEDEETLQLKLQAIEAKLKLKRIQQAKAKLTTRESENEADRPISRMSTASVLWREGSKRLGASQIQTDIQVPLSPPQNRKTVPSPQKSPARVLLGIDKGLRAQDVSLKRASSTRSTVMSSKIGPGPQLFRPGSVQQTPRLASRSGLQPNTPRPKTFSERIAESRQSEREKQEKGERIRNARSRGFSTPQEIGALNDGTSSRSSSQQSNGAASTTRSRDEAIRHLPLKPSLLNRTRSVPNLATNTSASSISSTTTTRPESSHQSIFSRSSLSTSFSQKPPAPPPKDSPEPDADGASFEPFSGLHLTKRLIPHTTLTRTLENRQLFTLPRLLKTVKAPDYDPPDIESDYVIIGIIASKTSPQTHTKRHKTVSSADPDDDPNQQRRKYMVLRLTDLKWEIDLFLFDTGFERFWKMTTGTVIAILNPGIMPPLKRDTGAFSLKLSSSDDTVLEIGQARDLGFCKSVKKDGNVCSAWVDRRKTEFCEFHVALQLQKTKAGRMEVNGMSNFGGGGGSGASSKSKVRVGNGWISKGAGASGFKEDGLLKEGRQYDKFLHESYYIAPSLGGRNTASLLDEEDRVARTASRGEAMKRRQMEREKENELAKKLGDMGGGMGGEYLRIRWESRTTSSSKKIEHNGDKRDTPTPTSGGPASQSLSAASLGLLKRAEDVSLGPAKRKRDDSQPMGWGGAFKRGWLSPTRKVVSSCVQKPQSIPENEPKMREISPVKKKARFILEAKGIREPGRDSLGGQKTVDDDDELEII